jgi:CBS domain-containing membrane protein
MEPVMRDAREPVVRSEHPTGEEMSAVLGGLLRRFQLTTLLRHHKARPVLALFSFVNGCISIGILAVVALISGEPFIFPSLGPTAFIFFYTPMAPTASPRNTIVGHFVGVVVGWLSLVIFGLTDAGSVDFVGMDLPRVGAAALSLGLTSAVLVLLGTPHPPATSTTLIVSLGLMTGLSQFVVLMIAVLLITAYAFVVNRLAGLPYPVWAPKTRPEEPAVMGPAP